MFSKNDGNKLLELARNTVKARLDSEDVKKLGAKAHDVFFENRKSEDFLVIKVSDEIKKRFSDKKGVFVTITENGELRGCIGYIEPIFSLWKAILNAATGAAFSDPRFMPLAEGEYENLKFEVSVLTEPELIKAPYEENIEIGKHGLIVEQDGFKGLLLPQVAPEWKWNKRQFLEHTCIKAGLDKDAYKNKETKVYKFGCEVFEE